MSVDILDELVQLDELFEGVARPEIDISQTKPHGESRYTGRALPTAEISRPTRDVVESTWMGLGLHIKQQLQQVRRAPRAPARQLPAAAAHWGPTPTAPHHGSQAAAAPSCPTS